MSNKKEFVIFVFILLPMLVVMYFVFSFLFYPHWLLRSAENGRLDTVIKLLDKGVDINTKDEWSGTPMMYAAGNGHTDIVALLLERGVNINSTSRLDRTPLMWAANRGRDDTVRFLIDKGADIHLKDREGKTALMLAIERDHESTAAIIRGYLEHPEEK